MVEHNVNASLRIVEPKGSSLAAFFLAIMVFARCMPYFLWAIEDYQRVFCTVAVPLICMLNMKIRRDNSVYFFLFFISFFVLGLHRGGIIGVVGAAVLCFIPLINEGFVKKTYHYFNYVFCSFLVLSLINYVVYLFGASPLATIDPINKLKSYDYGMYPFLVVSLDGGSFQRFCGLFDEPGVIGTIAGLMLFINRFDLKRWYNVVLLIGGVLSFSLFFYVIIVFAPFIVSKNRKTRLVTIGLLAAGFLLIIFNPMLYDIIGYRFNWIGNNGTIAGNNRTNADLNAIIASERFSYSYWWGHSMSDDEEFWGQSSLLYMGFLQGFLFVYLNIAAYITMAFKLIWRISVIDFLLFILLFMACIYQRPYLFDINYIFLFTALVYSVKDAAIKKKLYTS